MQPLWKMADDPSLSNRDSSDLLKQIYQLAVDPDGFDQFLELWEEHVTAQAVALAEDQAVDDADVSAGTDLSDHFELAAEILRRQGRSWDDAVQIMRRSSSRAAILLDRAGRVVWFNGAAGRQLYVTSGQTLTDLPLTEADRDDLRDWLEFLDSPVEQSAPLLAVRMTATDAPMMTLRAIRDSQDTPFALLTDILPEWPIGLEPVLISKGCSTAEIDISRQVFDGHDAAEIAERRGRSVATVRTQMKSVMAKLGVHSQVKLARVLVSLAFAAGQMQHVTDLHGQSRQLIRLPHRECLVYFAGPQTGRPLLYLHGMMEQPMFTPAVLAELAKRNLRVISPVRPNFGDAPADASGPEQAKQAAVRDVVELVEQLELSDPIVVGHLAGSVYMYDVALALGDRLGGLVSLSGGAPIRSRAQLDEMSRRPRLMAYTARYTPRLLPFVLRAAVRELDHRGVRRLMHQIHELSEPDLAALSDSDVFHRLTEGYRFAIAQGHRAFEVDAYHVVRDWEPAARAVPVPIHFIHGADDGINRLHRIEAFASNLPNATLSVIPDGGQLILFTKPGKVLDALLGAILGAD